MSKKYWLVGLVLFVAGMLVGCLGASTADGVSSDEIGETVVTEAEVVEVEVTRIVEVAAEAPDPVEVEVTRVVEVPVEVEVTRIVEVVKEPEPMPREEFLNVTGSGTFVTENYQWGSCRKAVFYSDVVGGDRGNFIARVEDLACTDNYCGEGIANMITPDESHAETVVNIEAGEWFVNIEHAPDDAEWTIRAECQS